MYKTLLKILEDKDRYYRFVPFIKDHTVPQEVQTTIKAMREWFEKGNDHVNWDSFVPWFKLTKVARASEEKHSIYDRMLSNMDEELDPDEIKPVIETLIEQDYAIKIGDHAMRIAEGDDTKSVSDIEEMIDNFNQEVDRASDYNSVIITSSFEDLMEDAKKKDGLEWRLEELNVSVGPIGPEDFCLFAAAPDSGKTSMLASEASFMAGQLPPHKKVVWFNNEEAGKKVKRRILQASIGWTQDEMLADPIAAKAAIEEAINGDIVEKIVVVNEKNMDINLCQSILDRQGDIGLVIFDQLHNIQGFDKVVFSEFDKINRVFKWGRGIGCTYETPVITVHQADGTAQGQMFIELHQLYMSRVAVQSNLDVVMTLGKSYEPSEKLVRGLNIAKNKMEMGPRTIPDEKQGRYKIEIDPFRCRFTGAYER